RRHVLRELMLQVRGIGDQHLRHALKLGRLLRHTPAVRAGDQHMNLAAQRGRSRDRFRGYRIESAVVVLRDNQGRHQITPASVFSFSTSSATLDTLTPDLRAGGSAVCSTLRRGAMSTPKSAAFLTSSGFFFAFMMLGSEA